VMAISMAISGVSVSPAELILFPLFTVIFTMILWILFKNFKSIDNIYTY
jgi:lipopolysaccharide export LptBFGC system permease protein LptF